MSTRAKPHAPSIFVSYRVADTLTIADRLAVELKRRFGAEAVFFDRRTIEPGDAWDSTIEMAVKNASVVLVLIGKKWLTEQNEYGRRRLDVPGDWVRREVETALVGSGSVIPVLVDDAPLPPKEAFADLPSLKALSSRQGVPLRTKDWDRDFAADLLCYPHSPERWSITHHPLTLSGSDFHTIGYGLSTIGLFGEAQPWYERAVAAAEQGDVHGRVDQQSLEVSKQFLLFLENKNPS